MDGGLVSAPEPEGRPYGRGRKLHKVTEKRQSYIGRASDTGYVRWSINDMSNSV